VPERRVMRNYRAVVEYDGTDFAGFQYQSAHRSVQGELEAALRVLTRREIRVNGAGRTDAGVHALGQVISFRADMSVPTGQLALAMNSVLGRDVAVCSVAEVEEDFHARFSARRRSYVYAILNRACRSGMFGRYTLYWPDALDVPAMSAGARFLLGRQDVSAWANELSEARSTVRTISRCSVGRFRDLVLVRVEADAFLHGMVRNVVGTLLQVGSGKRPPDDIAKITRSRLRSSAGPSAPARGLCLLRVTY